MDVNGINKMAGEWYHILYNNVYGIRACALRLTNTIGPRMRIKDARQTFLGIWIRSAPRRARRSRFGVASQLRDFNFVDDAVDAFLMAATDDEAFGHAFNLGSREVVSLKDLAEMLVEVNGSGEFRNPGVSRPIVKKIDIGDYYSDFSQIEVVLGLEAEEPTSRSALAITLDYYRENLAHYL